MTLDCWMKWVLSGAATVGALAGVLLAATLTLVLVGGVLYVASLGFDYLWRRFVPQDVEARWEALRDRIRYSQSPWFCWFMLAIAAAFYVWLLASTMMQDIFGCNECLPEAVRQKCEATLTEMEAKDREDFERICALHPGWCK